MRGNEAAVEDLRLYGPLMPAEQPVWLTDRLWRIAVLRFREGRYVSEISRIMTGVLGSSVAGDLAVIRRKLQQMADAG